MNKNYALILLLALSFCGGVLRAEPDDVGFKDNADHGGAYLRVFPMGGDKIGIELTQAIPGYEMFRILSFNTDNLRCFINSWTFNDIKYKEEFLNMIKEKSFTSEFKTKDFLNELGKLLQDFVSANTTFRC